MSDRIKLSKLVLETKEGKKVEISLDEAKDLYYQLHELFGVKTSYVPTFPIIREVTYPLPHIWVGTSVPTATYGTITCGQNTEEVMDVVQCKSGLNVAYFGQHSIV